jgi:hypothetical protein
MRASQLESRRVMVEFGFTPTFILMANFASAFLHALGKLSGVRIRMASGATLIRKNKKQFAGEWPRRLARVAIAARHGLMRSRQRE